MDAREERPAPGPESRRGRIGPKLAPVVRASLETRYPYHDAHLWNGEQPADPTLAHPAFGNSFDWHSSVHSQLTAARLADAGVLDRDAADGLRAILARTLAPANLAAEAAYFDANPHYERPYGWAWAIALAGHAVQARRELGDGAAIGSDGADALAELGGALADRAVAWLEVMPEPVRHGVHSNSAFALARMLDGASALGRDDLAELIRSRADDWFRADAGWPAWAERSGHDFLSPSLAEADLLRRVLEPDAFAAWLDRFLPELAAGAAPLEVVGVPEGEDGHLAHRHGLNLSRAAMLARILAALEAAESAASAAERERRGALRRAAEQLADAGFAATVGDDFLSTHWLPTFAWDAAVALDSLEAELARQNSLHDAR